MVRRSFGDLVGRIGKRGTALLFFGFLDLVYAVSLAFPVPEVRRSATVRFVESIAPLPFWATLWATVGIVCLIGSFLVRDQFAFAAAIFLKILWGVVFLIGWLAVGLERGYVSAAIWLAFAGFVGVISSWPEPPRTRRPT